MKSTLRLVLIAALSTAMVTGFALEAAAKVKPKTLGAVSYWPGSVAVDPAGNPHYAYQGTDYRLYHARFDGRRWQHELVDGTSECGWGISIAIDALSRIHITYFAQRTSPDRSALVYARFDGLYWQITELPVLGGIRQIKMDTNGRPHAIFVTESGRIGYAKFDGLTWQTQDAALEPSWVSSGFAVDGFAVDNEGNAHICLDVNFEGCFYATNKSGSWELTNLVAAAIGPTAIGLDNDGKPRVLVGTGSSITCFRHDGTNWNSEVALDLTDTGDGLTARIDDLTMAMDTKGRARVLASAHVSAGDRDGQVSFFMFDNGAGWNGMLVDPKNAGFSPSIALDANDVVYGIYRSALINYSYGIAKWARIALPDLTGAWSNVTVTATGGVSTLTGVLTITNRGLEKAGKTAATLWLSDDEIINASDESLSVALKVKSLKPGASVTIPVKFKYNGALTSKHLGAVIDPDMLTYDNNLLDNIATVSLFE